MKESFVVIAVLVILILTAPSVRAGVEFGGELETAVDGYYYRGGETEINLEQKLNLDLYFSEYEGYEPRFEVDLSYPIQDIKNISDLGDGDFDYFIKKMYVRRKGKTIDFNVGRQPVSWSFGSLLNPVDYNLGAVVLEEETQGKYVDAVEGYLPLNWNSGITAVASFPEDSDQTKWGVRGRLGFQGYDLTLNYVREPEAEVGKTIIPSIERAGLTLKGDLGPVGVYSALGYSEMEGNSSNSFLLGTDYSYSLNYGMNHLGLQLEYLRMSQDDLYRVLGASLPTGSGNDPRLDLLMGNIDYELDEFSSLSLAGIVSLDDGSLMLRPGYQTHLGYNWDLELNAIINSGDRGDMFAPEGLESGINLPRGVAEISLSYPF